MTFWIKRWGREDRPYRDFGLPEHHLTFSDRASTKGVLKVVHGDRLIILGVRTHGALVAVVTATGDGTPTEPSPQYRWRIASQVDAQCPVADAPNIRCLPDLDEGLWGWYRTPDGLRELTKEQFKVAEREILKAVERARKRTDGPKG